MNEKHHILINIDTILDTFLSSVEKVNPEWKTLLLSDKKYINRVTNNLSYYFPVIDNKKVMEEWNNRNKETLQMSKPTALLYRFYINRKSCYTTDTEAPGYRDLSITLNIYPYELDYEEIQIFREMIGSYFFTEEVKVISKPINKMNPTWIKNNFQQVILYDFNEWMGTHIEGMKNSSLENVIFTFPIMLLNEITPVGKSTQEMVYALRTSLLGILKPDIIPLEDLSYYPIEETKKE